MRTVFRGMAAVAAVAMVALTGCAEKGGTGEAKKETGDITVGAVLDLTGAGASLAQPEKQTLELLTKQVNDAGGVNGRKIKLVIEDNQSAEDKSSKAAQKLITQDKASVIIGASRSATSIAIRDLAETSKIPTIALAASSKIIEGKKWVFKTVQNDAAVIENFIDIASEKGWKTLGLARDGSAFGEGVEEMINATGSAKGIKVVKTEKFKPDEKDFTPQMLSLKGAAADANIIWGIPPAAALAQKAYKQLVGDKPVLQSHGIGNNAFLEGAGADAEGITLPLGRLVVADQLPANDPQKPVVEKFLADFKAAYSGSTPSTFAGHAYDAFQLAIDAFKKVGTDPQKVRDHLEGVQGFVGTTGVYNFSATNHSGLDKRALAIVTVAGGKWKLVNNNRG